MWHTDLPWSRNCFRQVKIKARELLAWEWRHHRCWFVPSGGQALELVNNRLCEWTSRTETVQSMWKRSTDSSLRLCGPSAVSRQRTIRQSAVNCLARSVYERRIYLPNPFRCHPFTVTIVNIQHLSTHTYNHSHSNYFQVYLDYLETR